MDRAKLQKMREVGVRVVRTCQTCRHREPADGRWSHCTLHEYEHEKHTGTRTLPAHDALVCDSWEAHSVSRLLLELGEYANEPWLDEQ
jgi:hypothetical protein